MWSFDNGGYGGLSIMEAGGGLSRRLRWWSFDNGGYGGGLSIMEAGLSIMEAGGGLSRSGQGALSIMEQPGMVFRKWSGRKMEWPGMVFR